jgi:nitric oxide dioxygenase
MTIFLEKIIEEAKDVKTLEFSFKEKALFFFQPGQYVNVAFTKGNLTGQVRSYTISGMPNKQSMSITVKKYGPFSTELHNLKVGDKLEMYGPEGYFYPSPSMNDIVFIAGGIGIVPFFTILQHYYMEGMTQKTINLFYSNKLKGDITYFDKINNIAEDWKTFKVIYLLTKDKVDNSKLYHLGRLDRSVLKKHLTCINKKNRDYFICGSIQFVDDFWGLLRSEGVSDNNIYTEAFFTQ